MKQVLALAAPQVLCAGDQIGVIGVVGGSGAAIAAAHRATVWKGGR